MNNKESRLARKDENSKIDYGIIFPVLMLAIIGLGSIYVAATHDTSGTSVLRQVLSQVIWYALGIVISRIVAMSFCGPRSCVEFLSSLDLLASL